MRNVEITVNGGIFNGDIALTGGQNKTNLETLVVTGGTFNGAYGFYSYGDEQKAMDAISVSGGSFLADPTEYLDSGVQAVQSGERWFVR
jgi:hypothetical protein